MVSLLAARFKDLFWLAVVTALIYYNFIVLTDQIIAGKL